MIGFGKDAQGRSQACLTFHVPLPRNRSPFGPRSVAAQEVPKGVCFGEDDTWSVACKITNLGT